MGTINGYATAEVIVYFLLFALVHSILAQERAKRALTKFTGTFFMDRGWRFFYFAASWYFLYQFFFPKLPYISGGHVYGAAIFPIWVQVLQRMVGIVGAVIAGLALLQLGYFEFTGIKQIFKGSVDLAGVNRIETTGIYGWMRHPMYVGGFMIAISYTSSTSSVAYLLMYTLYALIGSRFEERRLIRNMGDAYESYRMKVGAFMPRRREI